MKINDFVGSVMAKLPSMRVPTHTRYQYNPSTNTVLIVESFAVEIHYSDEFDPSQHMEAIVNSNGSMFSLNINGYWRIICASATGSKTVLVINGRGHGAYSSPTDDVSLHAISKIICQGISNQYFSSKVVEKTLESPEWWKGSYIALATKLHNYWLLNNYGHSDDFKILEIALDTN